jgi:L-seryl-tRNA(Ser) seleniumtransferase
LSNILFDPRPGLGLRTIINVSGTMTELGACIASPEVVAAVSEILPHFVEIDELQRLASKQIALSTGSQAGYITASSASALTLAVAASMTGSSLSEIEQLPDTQGMRSKVLLQMGHAIHYGASIEQTIRLSGAEVRLIGTATLASGYQLEAAIDDETAAAVFVVSHHVVNYGQISLPEFVQICHARNVPVIVDAASEYDLHCFLSVGADIVIYSAHKFLGGCTAGVVAGKLDLVRGMYLQNRGIGRGFKVGKESILGSIAALKAWSKRDHIAVRAREDAALLGWMERFALLTGVQVAIEPDPTDNPLSRLKMQIDPASAGITAWDLADRLAQHDPPIIVRDQDVEQGFFFLDPCNLHPGQEQTVADAVIGICRAAMKTPEISRTLAERRAAKAQSLLTWPD